MSRIVWDALGERLFEIGLDRGVLYTLSNDLEFTNGIPWNGLVRIEDESEGYEGTPLYVNDTKADSVYTFDEYGGTIKAYTYPDEFEKCFGEVEIATGFYARQQERPLFGFTYRTLVANDIEDIDYAYKIHLVYNAKVKDYSRSYSSTTDSFDSNPISIPFETFPVTYNDYLPISEIVIDSRKVTKERLQWIENILYGSDISDNPPRMPSIEELIQRFEDDELTASDWYGYPNNLLYPDNDFYPGEVSEEIIGIDTITRSGSVTVTLDSQEFINFSPAAFIGVPAGYSILGISSYYCSSNEIIASLLSTNSDDYALQFTNTAYYPITASITINYVLKEN